MATTQQEQAQVRRRNPRGQGDRLREEIITAASELIAESGDADQLSLRAVAKRIGIAAPSIYRHFPDAEHLKMAVVERNFATFAAARDRASAKITDPAAALLARCRAYCQFAVDNPGPYRFMFSHQAPPADPERPSGGPAALQGLAASIARCQDAGAALRPRRPGPPGRPGVGRPARADPAPDQPARLPLARSARGDGRPGRRPPDHPPREPARPAPVTIPAAARKVSAAASTLTGELP